MRKLKNALCGGALAGMLAFTQLLTPMAYAAGNDDAGSGNTDEKPAITLEEGTYVPGEAIICVKESAPSDEMIAAGAYGSLFNRLFDRIPGVESEELMDVSRAAALIEEEEKTGDTDPGILDAAGAEPETTVIKAVRSDTLSTEELIKMYSGQPGVVFAEPNYISSIEDLNYTDDSSAITSSGVTDTVYHGADKSADVNKTVPAGIDTLSSTGDTAGSDTKFPPLTHLQYGFGYGPGGMDVPGWDSKTPNADKDKYGRDIVVAVVDTGVDYNHPDLKNVMWDEGLDYNELVELGGGRCGFNSGYGYYYGDFPTGSDDPMDVNGHGTHCAGVIAAEWDGCGVSGIAGGARIMALKQMINDEGQNNIMTTSRAFNYIMTAKKAGVNVVAVNCSFGGTASSLTSAYLIKELGEAGIVVCRAAGNAGHNIDVSNDSATIALSQPSYVNVGSVAETGMISSFSNYGIRSTHLFSPGSGILSTYPLAKSDTLPKMDVSEPVTVSDNILFSDSFESFEKSPFTYEANPNNGTTLEMKGNELWIDNTDLNINDDAVTRETVGAVESGKTVALTAVSRYVLSEPADGKKYSLILENRSESGRSEYFTMVYVKTESGSWERPGYTNGLELAPSQDVYPLDKSLNGNPFKLNPLEIRLVLFERLPEINASRDTNAIVSKMWITDADPMPYHILSGTSMATPAVAGEAAVLAKAFPDDTADKRAMRILAGVRFDEKYSEKSITGGVASVSNSLDEDKYTPVLNSIWADPDGIHVSGYFFGEAKDLYLSLTQTGRSWNTDKDKGITGLTVSHDPDDPDLGKISFDIPNGVRGNEEVIVEIKDSSKKDPARSSFRRLMTLSDPYGCTETLYRSIPVDLTGEQFGDIARCWMSNAQPLNGCIYYLGYDETGNLYRTWRYEPVSNKWTEPEECINGDCNVTSWNGMILFFSGDYDEPVLSYYDGTKVVRRIPMLPVKDDSIPASDEWVMTCIDPQERCDLYNDGENVLVFRTLLSDNDIRCTAVYDLDPFTGMGRYIGKLKHSYVRGITIAHEETETGNNIYIMGFNTNGFSGDFYMEKFRVKPEGQIDSEVVIDGKLPVTGDGETLDTGLKDWNGCGVKDGILMTGLYSDRAEASGITGFSPAGALESAGYYEGSTNNIADNYFFSYDHPEWGFRSLKKRMAEPLVYFPVPAALEGKVYFFGFTKDRFVMSYGYDDDVFDSYGDRILPGADPSRDTDTSVKMKKLSFKPSKITVEAVTSPKVIPIDAVFADPAATTDVYFESSDPLLLRVNPLNKNNGAEIWPVRSGTATVTAYCGNKTAKCSVTIEEHFFKEPDELSINKENVTLKTGEIDVLTLGNNTHYMAQPYLTGREKIKWKSSNTKAVTVKNGVITAKKAGEAEVTATWSLDKDVRTYTCRVKVTDIAIPKADKKGDADVKLSLSANKLKAEADKPALVTAKLSGAGCANRKVTFRSSNPDILTIGEGGEESVTVDPVASGNKAEAKITVNPIAPGNAYVIVESGPEGAGASQVNRALCSVAVSAPVTELSYAWDNWLYMDGQDKDGNDILRMRPGEITTINYFTDPEKCTDLGSVKWSAKGGTATVKNGVVTAKKVKKDKEGNTIPTTVTLKIGKTEFRFLVYVE